MTPFLYIVLGVALTLAAEAAIATVMIYLAGRSAKAPMVQSDYRNAMLNQEFKTEIKHYPIAG